MRDILKNFIVLEGGDGTGTSTQLSLIAQALTEHKIPHMITHEPNDFSDTGMIIRKLLRSEPVPPPEVFAYLFAADRFNHLYGYDGIMHHLDRGEVVVCDRYIASSLAYQGLTCGEALPWVLNENFPLPGLTLFFELNPATAMERMKDRDGFDLFENLPFQEKIALKYKSVIENLRARYHDSIIITVDASQSIAEVKTDVLSHISNYIDRNLL